MKQFEIDGLNVEEGEFQSFLNGLEMDLDTYDSNDDEKAPAAPQANFTSYEAENGDGRRFKVSFMKEGDREENSIQPL